MRKLTWEELTEAAEDLGNNIKASNFKPDYIIGIAHGGLIPLALLAKQLQIENILSISASAYANKKRKEFTITYMPKINLSNKTILLVDEIADSGETLKKIAEKIAIQYKVKEVKTATIAVNTDHCKFYPDFWIIEEAGEWVVFPWEKEEFGKYSTKQ